MNYSRGFQSGFRRAGMQSGFFKNYQNQFRNQARMQCFMSMNQMSMFKTQFPLIQGQQTRLLATNNLLTPIQINSLLTNEEAELGLTSISEDLGKDI